MKAHVSTAQGRANIFQDESGVHLRIIESSGTIWEAGFFPANDHAGFGQAWENAIALARDVIDSSFAARH